MYNNCIASAENEVAELREKLDEYLDYLGNMQRQKWELERG